MTTSTKFDWREHLETVDDHKPVSEAVKDNDSEQDSFQSFYQNMKEVFQDYCKTSSVHGVKYFTEPKRHWIERLWWIITMILSVIGSILVTKEVYNKWQKSPVIVSFAEKYTRVSEIPFPAVTICPETKARSSILNFTNLHNRWVNDGLEKLEKEEKDGFIWARAEYAKHVHFLPVSCSLKKMIAVLQVAPSFNETLVNCKFQNREELCRDYFQQVITEEGLCYTFNSLDSTEIYRESVYRHELFDFNRKTQLIDNWSLDSGYSSLNNKSYPLRVFGSGTRDGLMITFSLNRSEFDDTCRSHVQGFKIQLHMPGVIPQLSKHYLHMPMQRDVLISVNPQVIKTDEDLHLYAPGVRQCYFSYEKRLQFFEDYTKPNCDFECLTNFTLLRCGCVRFSMPRAKDKKICGIKSIDCCIDAEDELLRKDDGLLGNNEFDDCNCLPSCTSYSYGVEQSHNIIKTNSDLSDEREIAIVRIFFNKKQFISSKRSKLYGQTELLANFGGLLGFFLGISLLSFVEIVYFFTLRTYLLVNRKISQRNSSAKQVTGTKSNVTINIIRTSEVNTIDRKSPISKKGKNFFTQRRKVANRNESIRQGSY